MSELDQDLLRELLATFREEAAEHLQTLNQALLQLERNPPQSARQHHLQDAFRAAHSLKGAARAVSLEDIENLSHAMENVLQSARDAGAALGPDTCDVLYDTLDGIENLLAEKPVDIAVLTARLDALESGADGAGDDTPAHDLDFLADDETGETEMIPTASVLPGDDTAADAPPAGATANGTPPAEGEGSTHLVAGEETIRVSVRKLDDLMAQVGELLVSKISAEQRRTDIQQLRLQVGQWSKTWRELKALLPRINGETGLQLNDVLNRHATTMNGLLETFADLDQSMNRDVLRLGMVSDGLQDKVRRVRMVPFQSISLALERAVRDAARSEGKIILFEIEGGDTELDKKVLESLKDPLLHLLRNSVGHGIERPEDREAAGKPLEGHITLSISQRGSEVRIRVRDDGKGFDIDSLRRAYMRRGGVLEEAASEQDILETAFMPGVSTAQQVTTISGRGVGLDVVREQIESIQGRIVIDNKVGQGASISLVVPTSLAMTRGLLVIVGGEHYVLPLLSVEKIVEVQEHFAVGGKHMLRVDGQPLPVNWLASVLERPVDGKAENMLAVIMGVAEQRLALLVNDVMTEVELAIKPLGNPLKRVRNVAGCAVLGSGEPVIILNPADLLKSARRSAMTSLKLDTQQNGDGVSLADTHILVVDDSITTRTLEKNILEAAGFTVTTATDGREALKRLEEHAIDLVVSDVQMPQMDGISLVRHIRDTGNHSHLPLILVTSLESREDRERGMLAGADAYIVKRGFDQAELLATIQRLL